MATLSTFPSQTSTRIDAPGLVRFWHLASLDAPTVAVTWTFAFAWAARVRLPLWLPVVVGLSAWAFYIADRLLDARSARTPLRPRHHFHWQHRRVFLPLALAAALVALALVLHSMPLVARARDSVLAAAALAYFTGVHTPGSSRRFLPKELLVAIVFTAACAVPMLPRATAPAALVPMLLIFAALAWLNCNAIESWESTASAEQRGERLTGGILRLALLLGGVALLAVFGVVALHQPRVAALLAAAALSAACLGLLDYGRDRLTPTALRAAADLVLLTPALLIPLVLLSSR